VQGLPETLVQPSHYETAYLKVNTRPGMSRYSNRQSGVALIIGLVMLLLLTIIMLSAVQVSSLEEKMAGNLRNYNIAFQSAESALREAEEFIDSGEGVFNPIKLSNGPFQNTITPICVAGICGTSSPLQSADINSTVGKQTASTGISDLYAEPQYIVELIRVDPSVDSSRIYATFRITTRAWGEDPNSFVQLQSTFRIHALSFVH
jgi:type IV pilus assembly protein PilX